MTATTTAPALPLGGGPVLVAALVAALLVVRWLKQTVLKGAAPPTLEGLPLVGGVVKFARVRLFIFIFGRRIRRAGAAALPILWVVGEGRPRARPAGGRGLREEAQATGGRGH